MLKPLAVITLLAFTAVIITSCGIEQNEPRTYYASNYDASRYGGRSFGELHNIIVAELSNENSKTHYQSFRDLMFATHQNLTATIGNKDDAFDISQIDEGFRILVDEDIAEPWVDGHFDDNKFINLIQATCGLPDIDADVLSSFLSLTESMDFNDPIDVQSKVTQFSNQYGIIANDGTFIGLILDIFLNSYEYWSADKNVELSDGTGILGDTLVGAWLSFAFTPIVGFWGGAAWSYIYEISDVGPGEGEGCVVWNDGYPY